MPSEPGLFASWARIARPELGLVRRRGDAARAVGFHQRAAVGLLIVGHAHLEDGHVDAEQRAGEGERGAPLASAGLGGEPLDARLLVVPSLRHRRVRLVRAGRRDALILVVDLGRGAERLLQDGARGYSGDGRHMR